MLAQLAAGGAAATATGALATAFASDRVGAGNGNIPAPVRDLPVFSLVGGAAGATLLAASAMLPRGARGFAAATGAGLLAGGAASGAWTLANDAPPALRQPAPREAAPSPQLPPPPATTPKPEETLQGAPVPNLDDRPDDRKIPTPPPPVQEQREREPRYTGPPLKLGDTGPEVARLKERLADLGYLVDSGSTFTQATRDAVMAFQKVNDLDRDGAAGPQTQRALRDPKDVELGRGPRNRVDVDLSSQTMTVVRGGKVDYIVNATTGDPNHPDGKGMATREGSFNVFRKHEGTWKAPLGELYYPSFFDGGIAVHGSATILAERASHGCVRVPRWAEEQIYRDMKMGSSVVVHD